MMVEPASIPLPVADEEESLVLSVQKGSEDLITHDSEGEEDALSGVCVEEDASHSKVGFQKFMYVV